MGKQFKESKDNPFHRDFGVFSNTKYVLSKCVKYRPSVLAIALVGIVCSSLMGYYLGFFGKFVIDVVGSDASYDIKLKKLILIVIIGGLAGWLISQGATFAECKTWYRYIYIRSQVIEERIKKALTINYEFLEKPECLDISERGSQAIGGNWNGFEGMLRRMETLGANIVTLTVTFISVLVLDYRLIIALAILAVIQFGSYSFCIVYDKKNVWDKLGNTWRKINYMERITQNFEYAKDIRLFSMQDFLLKKQQRIYEERWQKFDLHQNIWYAHTVFSSICNLLVNAIVYGTLFYAVIKKDMAVGNFTLFLTLASSFTASLINFLQGIGDYHRASLEVDDLRSFLELDEGSDDNTIEIPKADKYTIEFRNVSYRYPEAEGFALKNFNLTIEAGEKLAIVGLNGAGKTTMIKLLMRLYEPTEGEVYLNGVDIKKFKREEYYKLFSPVFQDVQVMAFPIAENISMKSTSNTDIKRAYDCAAEAGLKDKLDSLPKGIETELLKVVDDEGVDFSGGEKQKLALARALYKNAPIVVLDEPTSALDSIAEQHLYESFDKMIGDKSAVYISHRLASTKFCDRVAMFKESELIEYGTHDELMKRDGEYAKMFALQAQYYQQEDGVNE